MLWKNESLDRLFNPDSIAVIGASDKLNRLGALTLQSLKSCESRIYPVNPRLSKIDDLKCYSSITEIPDSVDLALICVSGARVSAALLECAEAKIRSAIIFAAGYKETGLQGQQEQDRIKEIANEARIAVIGPNCLGAGNIHRNLNATFFPHPIELKKGNVSFVSQSGGVTGLMLYNAVDVSLGVAKFVSVGNRVNIDFHDLLRYFREDPETENICLFVEGTESARLMQEEMARTTTEKPVLAYKVGSTPAARDAAFSHTGSLAGKAELYSAAFKQARGLEVFSIMEMIDTAKILSIIPSPPKGNRVAILTHTLGIALIAAQTLEEKGVQLPKPSATIITRTLDILDMPIGVAISNPIDLLAKGWAEPDIFASVFKLLMESSYYDAIMIVFSPNYQENIKKYLTWNKSFHF